MQSAAKTPALRIGTRGSALALIQAETVRRMLGESHGIPIEEIEIVEISTAGDRSQKANTSLSEIGGKGLFSKEIESALLAGDIDLAVHSSKDMATELPAGLIMPIFLPREDVRDGFISPVASSLDTLPQGARVGTSSLRRRAQILRYRPDLEMVEFRGNVGTRLKKLEDGVVDATLLAAAGINRLGLGDHITDWLDPRRFPPAPGQGAIGIELRADDDATYHLLLPLNDLITSEAVRAERAMLAVLDGSCRTPIAALASHAGPNLALFGQVLSPDGHEVFEAEMAGAGADADAIGMALGERLIDLAGPEFLARLRAGAME